jgi:CTP:molybdopterin cytidylyltransferase MocA
MALASQTVAYIMSAGHGLRLGGLCKGRVLVNGQPLVARQIDLMQACGLGHVVVVVGHESEMIRAIVNERAAHWSRLGSQAVVQCIDKPPRVTESVAPDLQESLAFALCHAQERFQADAQLSGLLISLVDLPLLSGDDVHSVLRDGQSDLILARIPTSLQGQPGHPIWLSRRFVMTLGLPKHGFSLREALHGPSAQTSPLIERITTDALGYFTDIDTPACVAMLRSRYGIEISVKVSR